MWFRFYFNDYKCTVFYFQMSYIARWFESRSFDNLRISFEKYNEGHISAQGRIYAHLAAGIPFGIRRFYFFFSVGIPNGIPQLFSIIPAEWNPRRIPNAFFGVLLTIIGISYEVLFFFWNPLSILSFSDGIR